MQADSTLECEWAQLVSTQSINEGITDMVKQMTSEYELDNIKMHIFTVNDDSKLTDCIWSFIQDFSWEKQQQQNQSLVKNDLLLFEEELKQVQKVESKPMEQPLDERTFEWYSPLVGQLDHYKDITKLVPANTRFRFFKKMVNRIMMVTNQYQQVFNNVVAEMFLRLSRVTNAMQTHIAEFKNDVFTLKDDTTELSHTLSKQVVEQKEIYTMVYQLDETIKQLKKNNTSVDEQILTQSKIISEMNIQLSAFSETENCVKSSDFNDRNNNYDNRLNDLHNSFNDTSNRINGFDNRLNDLHNSFNDTSNRINGFDNRLSDADGRTNTIDLRLSQLQDQLNGITDIIATNGTTHVAENRSLNQSLNPSYSQSGEDRIIQYIFGNLPPEHRPENITYLDIGGNDYRHMNNTYAFYLRGFSGVLVEANPDLINGLMQNRPRDMTLNIGIGAKSGDSMPFYVMSADGVSSFNKDAIEETILESSHLSIDKIIDIDVLTINETIDRYCKQCPDLISIDIEGDELAALGAMDFKKYRPVVLVVEVIPFSKHFSIDTKRNELIDLMGKNGYAEVAFTSVNSIFVDVKKTYQKESRT